MLAWKKFKSIQDLPENIWDEKISGGGVCLSEAFMKVIEKTNPDDSFIYYAAYKENKIVGVGFAYVKRLYFHPSLKLIYTKILMTGTLQTYGKHYWFDSDVLNEHAFLTLFLKELNKEKVLAFIVRDYVGDDCHSNIITMFKKKYFSHIAPYGVALIKLNNTYENIYQYLGSLKKKHRNAYKKILKERDVEKLHFSYQSEIDVDLLYPLYLSVNSNSNEFKTDPLPKKFFHFIKSDMGEHLLVILLKYNEKVIGFVLIFEDDEQIVPFLMGIDYDYREKRVWHNLTLEAIIYAIKKKKKEVDLGLTGFEMKKRLGAVRYEIHMFVRFKSRLLNKTSSKLLKKII